MHLSSAVKTEVAVGVSGIGCGRTNSPAYVPWDENRSLLSYKAVELRFLTSVNWRNGKSSADRVLFGPVGPLAGLRRLLNVKSGLTASCPGWPGWRCGCPRQHGNGNWRTPDHRCRSGCPRTALCPVAARPVG